jgi:hypothetical protein
MGATFFNLTGLLLKGREPYIAEAGGGVKKSMKAAAGEEGYRGSRIRVSGIELKVRKIVTDEIFFLPDTLNPNPDTPLHVPSPDTPLHVPIPETPDPCPAPKRGLTSRAISITDRPL